MSARALGEEEAGEKGAGEKGEMERRAARGREKTRAACLAEARSALQAALVMLAKAEKKVREARHLRPEGHDARTIRRQTP